MDFYDEVNYRKKFILIFNNQMTCWNQTSFSRTGKQAWYSLLLHTSSSATSGIKWHFQRSKIYEPLPETASNYYTTTPTSHRKYQFYGIKTHKWAMCFQSKVGKMKKNSWKGFHILSCLTQIGWLGGGAVVWLIWRSVCVQPSNVAHCFFKCLLHPLKAFIVQIHISVIINVNQLYLWTHDS